MGVLLKPEDNVDCQPFVRMHICCSFIFSAELEGHRRKASEKRRLTTILCLSCSQILEATVHQCFFSRGSKEDIVFYLYEMSNVT